MEELVFVIQVWLHEENTYIYNKNPLSEENLGMDSSLNENVPPPHSFVEKY